MRVSSNLADLQIKLGSITRDGDELVVESAPGSSLDARITIDSADARSILGRMLRSGAVWTFLLRLPFARIGRGRRAAADGAAGARDNAAWRARREQVGLNKPW